MNTYLSLFSLNKDPFPEINGDTPEGEILSENDSGAYIKKCLIEAGNEDPVFNAGTLQMIYAYTKGDIKLINTICDYALHRAYYVNEKSIHENLLSECLELLLESKPPDIYEDDKRRHKRISTNLSGSFHIQGTKTRGMLTVTNISRSGIQVKLTRQRIVKPKDRANISFKLDDDNKSDIRTAVIIRHTFGFFAGCIFSHTDNTTYNQYLDALLSEAEKKWAAIKI